MSTRDTAWEPGTPCWVDLVSPDPQAAGQFYSALFGWSLDDQGEAMGNYLIAFKDGRRVGGIGSAPDQQIPPMWNTFLASADADATAAAVTANGGEVAMRVMDIPGSGRMFMAKDPLGSFFGVWQDTGSPGAEVANEPGTLTWNEYMSRDFDRAQAFYGTVFGYDWMDLSQDGFQYATAMVDGHPVGGVGGLPDDVPAEVPAHWMAYFKVEDCDASCARVLELGGTVQREAWDTPFGRMATVPDAQGAGFSLMADNAQSIANAAQAQGDAS